MKPAMSMAHARAFTVAKDTGGQGLSRSKGGYPARAGAAKHLVHLYGRTPPGYATAVVTNTADSTMGRDAEHHLLCRAGEERAV